MWGDSVSSIRTPHARGYLSLLHVPQTHGSADCLIRTLSNRLIHVVERTTKALSFIRVCRARVLFSMWEHRYNARGSPKRPGAGCYR
jgi:hypothetical protein